MTTALAVLAVIVSVAALVVSIWTGTINKRSAVAAEDSSVSADRAADAAKASAESAARVAQAEVERDHREYQPRPPEPATAFQRKANDRTGNDNLFLIFTLPRTYRVKADALHPAGSITSRSPLGVDLVIESSRQASVFIGELIGGKGPTLPESINVQFWPPVEGDPGVRWECPCGRPAADGESAHWEWNIDLPKDIDYDLMQSFG